MRKERKHIRLPHYDYSTPGIYFITICSYRKKNIFSKVDKSKIVLNYYGEIILDVWVKMNAHFPMCDQYEFVIMPNHIHALIGLNDGSPKLGTIIGSFKSAVTKKVNLSRGEACLAPTTSVWQRGYYEHVVRDEHAFDRISEYIRMNPENWFKDEENTNTSKSNPFYQWLNTYWK